MIFSRIRNVQPRAIFGLGISMIAFLALFQNCGEFRALSSSSGADSSLSLDMAGATKIATGIPYTSSELVSVYGDRTFARPVIMSAAGRVVYIGRFGDDSWQIVSVGIDGTGARRTLLSRDQFPNHVVTGFNVVPESGIIVALLEPDAPDAKRILVAAPENGAPSWTIASDVQNAQISQDGTRVNYVVGDGTSGSQVFTSTIVNPNPVQLGVLQNAYFHLDKQLSRSQSLATNVPTFYLVTKIVDDPGKISNLTATLFTAAPSTLPATLSFKSFSTFPGCFDFVRLTANGKYILVAPGGGVAPLWYEADGTLHDNSDALQSPDGSKIAATSAVLSTSVVYSEKASGTPSTTPLAGPTGFYANIWSADSRFLLFSKYVSATVTSWVLVDTETGVISPPVSSTGLFTNNSKLIGLVNGGQQFVLRDGPGGTKLSLVTTITGQALSMTSSYDFTKNYSNGVIDTGSRLIFQDGWGLYSMAYDGSLKTRLDLPRTSEPAISSADGMDPPAGSVFWDAASGRVLFEPVISTPAAYDFGDASHRLASVNLTSPSSAQYLTLGTKTISQVWGFEWDYKIDEDAGVIAFNSADGTQSDAGVRPSIMSWVSMQGGNATRVSPVVPPDTRYGLGTGYIPPVVFKNADASPRFVYDFYAKQGAREVHVQNGATDSVLSGFDVHMASPDGKWLYMVSDDQHPYLLRTDAAPGTQPTPIDSTLRVAFRGTCFGCGGTSTWTYTDDAGVFTADSKLIVTVTTQAASGSPTGNLLFDPSNLAAGSVPLPFVRFKMLADGKTVVAQVTDGSIALVSLATPNQPATLVATGVLQAVAGTTVVYTNGGGVFAVDTKTKAVTNLIPTTLPAVAQLYQITTSADGGVISYVILATNATEMYACANYHHVTVKADGTLLHDVGSARCAGANNAVLNSKGTSVAFVDADRRLYVSSAAGGWVDTPITPVDERFVDVKINPNGKSVLVISQNASKERVFAIYSLDGSIRQAVGTAMPAHKVIFDVQFTHDGSSAYFISDSAKDNNYVLYRVDLAAGLR